MWARHRRTGEPVYLEEGTADRVREQAKTELACIVPDCHAPISTRGGNKRDHFFHLTPGPGHEGTTESLNHLAGKAMLAQWARQQAPSADVVEEQTVKNHLHDLHRRPDVLVSLRTPVEARIALEVEYKSLTARDWQAKQDDLDAEGIVCTWLIGHTRLRPFDPTNEPSPESSAAVYVPPLGVTLAAAGRHVLVINPVTRQVGTLAGDPAFTSRIGLHGIAWLVLSSIDDCRLDPVHGLVTPAMHQIDQAVQRRERKLREAKRTEAERHERWSHIQDENRRAWDTSLLRETMLDRWGTIPALLSDPGRYPYGIHSEPAHWHAQLYEVRVHQQPAGYVFTVDDCWEALRGFNTNWDPKVRFRSLISFLESMEHANLIVRDGKYRWRTLADIDTVNERRRQAERERTQRKQANAEAKRAIREQRTRETADLERRLIEERERSHHAAVESEQAWLTSGIHRTVVDRFGGVPKCISWPGVYGAEFIGVHRTQWRAHICMELIADAPAGTEVSAVDGQAVLAKHGIPLLGTTDEVHAAIYEYLVNLRQRGILRAVDGDDTMFVTASTGLDKP
ncbi:MAG: hypothetical protein QOE61_520 [Micromonosporaceae bacterium]|nr:hypothetical protein [Micromonosporaceae bacterium]